MMISQPLLWTCRALLVEVEVVTDEFELLVRILRDNSSYEQLRFFMASPP
jgi:hypothetical protein